MKTIGNKTKSIGMMFLLTLLVLPSVFAIDLEIVGEVTLPDYAYGIFVEGNYAYTATSTSGLQIIDIDPLSPTYLDIVGVYDKSGLAMDVYVQGDSAYVAWYSDGLEIINIVSKTSPSLAATLDNNGEDKANSVWVDGDSIYVCQQSGGLDIIDKFGTLSLVNNYPIGNAIEAEVHNNLAHIVGGNGYGYHIVDISVDPPNKVGEVTTPSQFEGVTINGDYAYLSYTEGGGGADNKLYIYDISNPADIIQKGICQLVATEHAQDNFYYNGFIFITTETSGLEIVDVSNPESPVHLGDFNSYGLINDVHVQNGLIYIATVDNRMLILKQINALCGDVNNDELVNILDIVYLINYKYKSGPDPLCLPTSCCADVNSDGSINILDIVYLINYKYKDGPNPICHTGTVTDIDGNVYQTVKIGNQWWMAENLKVTKYRNGDPIPIETDGATWAGLTLGAYCEYDNDIANVDTYGRLYNWYAVNDPSGLAPEGWHVPTDTEWQTLVNYLGGNAIAGEKMKSMGIEHWLSPNSATNESGFTGLPGGNRVDDGSGSYESIGIYAYFWSTFGLANGYAYYYYLFHNNSDANQGTDKRFLGFSVRCVKD